MTKVNVLNIGEGIRTMTDTKGRPHNFPCGCLAEIDLPDEYIVMLQNSDRSRGNVFVIEDKKVVKDFPAEFMDVLKLLRDMTDISPNEMLQRAGVIFGRNAMRGRPQIDAVRQRLRRIASTYAVRGFTDWEDIMKNDATFDDPDGRTPDAIAAQMAQDERIDRAVNVTRQVAKPNIPRHLRNLRAEYAAAQEAQMESESRSGDDSYEAQPKRQIMGRVPTPHVPASTIPVEVSRNMATSAPGQLHHADGRPKTPDEIEAELNASPDVAPAMDAAPRRTVEQAPAPTPGRQARKRLEAPEPAPARKTAKAPAKKAPAKKAAKKGTARKTR